MKEPYAKKNGRAPVNSPAATLAVIKQWKQLKTLHNQDLCLLGIIGGYIAFDKDARAIAGILKKPAEREGRRQFILLSRKNACNVYLPKLRKAGYSVTFCDISDKSVKIESFHTPCLAVPVENIDEIKKTLAAKGATFLKN
jgi:hypothetical protein